MRIFVITKRTLIIALAVAVSAIVLAAIFLSFSFGSATSKRENAMATSSQTVLSGEDYELCVLAGQKKELPVYEVDRNDNKIALTIDAAWEDDKTPFILETLDKYGIKATFFLCGFWAEKYADDVKAIYDAGHELGNHTATHPHMNKLSAQEIQKEIDDFEKLMVNITGERTKLFRAPYGEYNDNVITTVRSLGYEVLQWNIDSIDWKEERSAQTILDTVLPKLKGGSIILCHNNGFKIKEYLPTLIEEAQKKGFEFVTISELLLDGDTYIDVNGVQKQK